MISAAASNLPKVSFGNKKLPKDTLIFNLPAVNTCPGKTEFCRVSCYALKAERMYKAVLPARKHNLKLSLREDFPRIMNTMLFNTRHKFERVRIHESGDFYSQAYFDKWARIAAINQGTVFYAYTKSFHLDFSKKPSNLILIASFDSTSTAEALSQYESKKAYFANTFTIVDRKAPATCIQDCTACDTCWAAKHCKITVNQH